MSWSTGWSPADAIRQTIYWASSSAWSPRCAKLPGGPGRRPAPEQGARKRALKAVDGPLAGADRVRRAARVPGFPITAYDDLTIRQVDRRLQELSRAELRRVRDYERGNKARKSLLRSLDR